jgi:hypothetical protein
MDEPLTVKIPHSELLELKDMLAGAISAGQTAELTGKGRKESIEAKDKAVYDAFQQLNIWLPF